MSKYAIFDFDGSIADSYEHIIKHYNSVSSRYKLSPIEGENKEKVKNLSAKELIAHSGVSAWNLVRLVKEVSSKLSLDIQNIPPIAGIKKLLAQLCANDVTVGIVTSNSKKNVEVFLKKWQIEGVQFIHSESNLFGKGRVLKRLLKSRKINPSEAVYIGDEVRDIEAAQQARIRSIAVTWGFNSETRLKLAKPNYLVHDPGEILSILST